MKNKHLIIIVILSICYLFSSFYISYLKKDFYYYNFDTFEKVKVYKKYKYKKYSFCYGNKLNCMPLKYKIKGSVNTNKIGTYTISYISKVKNKKFIKRKKINVYDDVKPKIIIEGEIKSVCPSGKVEGINIKATDNYDGDITSNIKYKVVNSGILYTVKDSSLNKAKKFMNAKIEDSISPNLILNGDKTMYLSVDSKYNEPGYTAIDNCDDDITNKVITEGKVDMNKPGSYEITYKVSDLNSNESVEKRIVKVFPKNNYSRENITSKTIYLTFDDGPGPYTQRLLDILGKYNVKATFFVTGYNDKYDNLLTLEHNLGHTVALHSYTHNYSYIYSSMDSYMEDLIKIQDKVKQYTGSESKVIRFPGGSSNTISRNYRVGIMSELTRKVEELGFRYFDWDISSGDAGSTTSSNAIYSNVINSIGENQANVVLMHDIKSYTVDAVENIITWGLSNGYTFAPLTVNSPVVHQKVNN